MDFHRTSNWALRTKPTPFLRVDALQIHAASERCDLSAGPKRGCHGYAIVALRRLYAECCVLGLFRTECVQRAAEWVGLAISHQRHQARRSLAELDQHAPHKPEHQPGSCLSNGPHHGGKPLRLHLSADTHHHITDDKFPPARPPRFKACELDRSAAFRNRRRGQRLASPRKYLRWIEPRSPPAKTFPRRSVPSPRATRCGSYARD